MNSNGNRLTLLERMRIKVQGKIQEVGFRPIVYGLASDLGLSRYVLNDGVITGIGCSPFVVDSFVNALIQRVPSLARVDSLILDAHLRQSNNLKLRRSKYVFRDPRTDS